MSARERLQGLQAALQQRGVQDAKFCFAELSETPLSHLVNDVADALQAYIDGRVTPLETVGDSVR